MCSLLLISLVLIFNKKTIRKEKWLFHMIRGENERMSLKGMLCYRWKMMARRKTSKNVDDIMVSKKQDHKWCLFPCDHHIHSVSFPSLPHLKMKKGNVLDLSFFKKKIDLRVREHESVRRDRGRVRIFEQSSLREWSPLQGSISGPIRSWPEPNQESDAQLTEHPGTPRSFISSLPFFQWHDQNAWKRIQIRSQSQ